MHDQRLEVSSIFSQQIIVAVLRQDLHDRFHRSEASEVLSRPHKPMLAEWTSEILSLSHTQDAAYAVRLGPGSGSAAKLLWDHASDLGLVVNDSLLPLSSGLRSLRQLMLIAWQCTFGCPTRRI